MRKSFFAAVLAGSLYTSLTFAEGFTLSLDREYDPAVESPSPTRTILTDNAEEQSKTALFRVVNHTPSIITLGNTENSFSVAPGKALLLRTTPQEGYYSNIPITTGSIKIHRGSFVMSVKELSTLTIRPGNKNVFNFYTRDQFISELTNVKDAISVILTKNDKSKSSPELDNYNQWLRKWSALLSFCDFYQPNTAHVVSEADVHQWIQSLLDFLAETIFIRNSDETSDKIPRSGCGF